MWRFQFLDQVSLFSSRQRIHCVTCRLRKWLQNYLIRKTWLRNRKCLFWVMKNIFSSSCLCMLLGFGCTLSERPWNWGVRILSICPLDDSPKVAIVMVSEVRYVQVRKIDAHAPTVICFVDHHHVGQPLRVAHRPIINLPWGALPPPRLQPLFSQHACRNFYLLLGKRSWDFFQGRTSLR